MAAAENGAGTGRNAFAGDAGAKSGNGAVPPGRVSAGGPAAGDFPAAGGPGLPAAGDSADIDDGTPGFPAALLVRDDTAIGPAGSARRSCSGGKSDVCVGPGTAAS